jgi:hypothetical protein
MINDCGGSDVVAVAECVRGGVAVQSHDSIWLSIWLAERGVSHFNHIFVPHHIVPYSLVPSFL